MMNYKDIIADDGKNPLSLYLILFFLIISYPLLAQTKLTPLPVGEHWSRRIVTENGHKRFYYRPDRFEYMEIQTTGTNELQLNGILTQPATNLDVTVRINSTTQKHTLQIARHDDKYYYTQPLKIQLDTNTESVWIYTRNPWAYFRGYSVTTTQRKPKTVLQRPLTFWNTHQLQSLDSTSEYFSGNSEHILSYKAETDGNIHFFIRAIRDGRKAVTIDILKNGELLQTNVLPNKTSKDYKIGDIRVTTGMRIELANIKAGDTISIVPKTEHEIITRFYLTK